ncbi:MAG TPA: hypothetical protein VHL98_07625 [Microvirga sp.]|jgi:hypothetical protein|nr:hypothetical protein [Microvirga sp.]
MRLGAFWRGRPKADSEAAARVKAWTRAALGAPDDTALAVNEIACTDPACPGIETVILVMEPGRKTRALKLAGALDAVTEAEVRAACSAPLSP